MFVSTIARTLAYAGRSWKTMVGVAIIALLVAALGSYLFVLVLAGGHLDELTGARGVVIVVGIILLFTWAQLAITRSAWPQFGAIDALEGALRATPRAIPLMIVVGLTYFALALGGFAAVASIPLGTLIPILLVAGVIGSFVLIVPYYVAIGAIARDADNFGLARAWNVGVRRTLQNLPIAAGAITVVAGTFALTFGMSWLAEFSISEGTGTGPGVDDLPELLVLVAFTLAGTVPATCISTAMAAAIHDQAVAAADEATWGGEDVSAVKVGHAMSSAVERLLASSGRRATDDDDEPSDGVPRRAPRLSIPPRAAVAGRLPGPGVMRVGEVILPAGALARDVTSETLELDGLVVRTDEDTAHIPDGMTMWVTAQPTSNASSLWKQLAAEFVDSGLWPILVPDASTGDSWIEQPGLRLRGAHDGEPGAEQVLVPRLEASLIDTPIKDVERMRSSELARGGLAPSTGRRADAIGSTIGRLGDSRIALVPAERPADVPTMVAWPGLEESGIASDELSSVIAAWERTYGALLVAVTAHALIFAVVRPPATEAEAIEIVAQQHALCPDEALPWSSDVDWATTLVDAPMWTLTWA